MQRGDDKAASSPQRKLTCNGEMTKLHSHLHELSLAITTSVYRLKHSSLVSRVLLNFLFLKVNPSYCAATNYNVNFHYVFMQLMVVTFSFLRDSAWNYGRLALVNRTRRRWGQFCLAVEDHIFLELT
jgi:hypothetical protein